jgi:hypothetical protein
MTTQQDRERWRTAMQKMGRTGVEVRLSQVHVGSSNEVTQIGDWPPWPARADVEEWLHDQDVAAARRERSNRLWMIVGVLAAIVAAITGVVAAITGLISVLR